MKEMAKLQKGGLSVTGIFKSNKSKINRITELADLIEREEREIDCAEVLNKIIFLYLQDAAIPFFRQDKLGVYNGAINLYAAKQINNCNTIATFYEKVIGMNQIDTGGTLGHIGNVTILDEKSFIKNKFVGKYEKEKLTHDSESDDGSGMISNNYDGFEGNGKSIDGSGYGS